MVDFSKFLGELARNILAFFVMIVLAVIGFFFTIFVVEFGATLAGKSPGADFVVLSAAVLVAASMVGGSGSAIGYMSRPISNDSDL